MSKRRKFSDEFKREAVGLTRQPGAQLSQVARDIGVGAGVLGRWRRELETDKAKAFACSGVPRDQEMATLKRELARVKTRSEEHTSELQSLMRISYAVFCLKKKITPKHVNNREHHIPATRVARNI